MRQNELFGNSVADLGVERLELAGAEVDLWRGCFSTDESAAHFNELRRAIRWEEQSIRIYGKVIPMPRLMAWYGDPGKSYSYSGITVYPHPWTRTLLEIKSRIEPVCGEAFNSVLLNLYRNEEDSVAWHADDEPELGLKPAIASVSFGETRRFMLKHRHDQTQKAQIALTDGSLLLMKGMTQHCWLHQVPKEARPCGPRINLTFRNIIV